MEKKLPGQDAFATEREAWIAAIPGEVDGRIEGVRQRIGRLSRQFERVLATVAEEAGLSVGDLEALSTLARTGDEGAGLLPSEMGALLRLTSGTISVRLERLERVGLVERVAGADGRQRPVRLTAQGLEVWGRATQARIRVEGQLINDALGSAEIEQLDTLLARLLVRLEAECGPAPRHDMTRGARGRS